MRKIGIGIAILVVLLLAAVLIIPSLVPSDVYRTRIQEQLSAELDREVEIAGDVSLSTFPAVRARTGAVRVGSPDGMADLASLEGLEARIRLLPLLSRRVEIKSFTLVRPTITLERTADGRVNWSTGEAPAEPVEAGPFRRDGRFTNIDPDISAFNIEGGTLRYIDRVAAQDVTVGDIDAFLSLPGLGRTLVVDGSLSVDGLPLTVDLEMDNPRAFLYGEAATLVAEVGTQSAELDVNGAFSAGDTVAFSGAVDAEVADAEALRRALGSLLPDIQGLELLRRGEIEAQVDYRGPQDIAVSGADFDLDTTAGTLRFAGDARYDGQPTASGRLDADITNAQALAPLLPEPVPGFDMLRTATLLAQLDTDAAGNIAIQSAEVKAAGDGFAATASGAGRYADTVSFKGPFTLSADDAGALLRRLDLPDIDPALIADAAVLGAVEATGTMNVQDTRVAVSGLDATTRSDVQSARYQGALSYADTLSLDGVVEATIPSLPALDARLATKIANSAAVGRVALKARLEGTQDALRVTDIDAQLTDGALNASYSGKAQLAETPVLDGRFTANIPDLSALAAATAQEVPYSDAIGRLSASGTVSGSPDALSLSGLDARMTDGQLNGSYVGAATLANETIALDGEVDVSGDSVRRLAALNGTELPPSTGSGAIFEGFGLSGQVGGTADAMQLSNAEVVLDAIRATGQFALSLQRERPALSGTLSTGTLDLRPYMDAYSAQNPTGEIQPWSEEPLPVDGLRAVDAVLDLRADAVKLSRLSLGPTRMDVRLDNGRLTGDLPSLALYGGKGRASFALDASQAVPTVALTAALDTLDNEGFLSALAGFAKASGTAGTTVDITGRGRSQAEIMRSLSGGGDYKVVGGTLSGIDAGEFLTGLETALRSRALPGGIGAGKATQFRDLLGAFTLENGVATVERFSLDAAGVSAEGSGRLDLGNQTLDFRFRPKATGDSARGLAAFGVPLRFAGGFGTAKPSLDTEFLGRIAAERARAEAGRVVGDRVGGPVGDILGGVLGGTAPAQEEADGATRQNPGAPSPAPREAPRLEGVVGGLLGGDRTGDTAPDAQPEPAGEPDRADTLEDAVLGIFGGKRRNSDTKEAEPDD